MTVGLLIGGFHLSRTIPACLSGSGSGKNGSTVAVSGGGSSHWSRDPVDHNIVWGRVDSKGIRTVFSLVRVMGVRDLRKYLMLAKCR